MKRVVRYLCLVLTLILIASMFSILTVASDEKLDKTFEGSGQRLDPYLISSVEDLALFRDLVNSGISFSNEYLLQTCDLDLSLLDELWEPIGDRETNNFFYGTYNGGGHVIENLNISGGNSGFFSYLGGSVINLGIESGYIEGEYVGAIASHATGNSARIINCYNKATVKGYRAGGIADNFGKGVIIGCWNIGDIKPRDAGGGLVGYNASVVVSSNSYGYSAFSRYFNGSCELITEGKLSDADISKLEKTFKENTQLYLSPIAQIMANSLEGEGTEEEPYLIRDVDDLIRFRELLNIGCSFSGNWVRQEADIDLSSIENWTPISPVGAKTYFHGTYDGAGHSISNLNIKGADDKQHVGFFSGFSGVIMNFGIESGHIEGGYAGGIVATAGGSIPMIINCYNKASVIGIHSAGGIAEDFSGGLIVNCLNSGEVSAESGSFGGICSNSAKRIVSSYSVGVPVVSEKFSGVVEDSCGEVDSIDEAVDLLNDELYEAATRTNYQRNDLFEWTNDAHFGERQNYFIKFIIREILIAVIVFAVLFVLMLMWKTARRESSLKLSGIKRTVNNGKLYLASGGDARIRTIVNLIFIFAVGMLAVGYINRDNTITYSFGYWLDSNDVFMDYLNPLNTLMNNNYAQEGHYTNVQGTYPPIARAIFWLTGQILPVRKQLIAASSMRLTYGAMLVFFVFAISFLILYIAYKKLYKDIPSVITLIMLLSAPMMFLVDRGNILIVAYVGSVLFVAGYRSKNPVTRHLSYICLAIAAAIKIYPVVLGLLVVREKKWKETLWCVLYGFAFCILPFFFIGGIPELLLYVRNVTTSLGENAVNFMAWLLNYSNVLAGWTDKLFGDALIGRKIASATIYILVAVLAACVILCKERWKALLAAVLIIILFPGYTVSYCGVFYTIPLLLLLKDTRGDKRDYVYAILLSLTLAPLQFVCGAIGVSQTSYWRIVGTIGVILAFMLIIDCTVCTVKRVVMHKRDRLNREAA